MTSNARPELFSRITFRPLGRKRTITVHVAEVFDFKSEATGAVRYAVRGYRINANGIAYGHPVDYTLPRDYVSA